MYQVKLSPCFADVPDLIVLETPSFEDAQKEVEVQRAKYKDSNDYVAYIGGCAESEELRRGDLVKIKQHYPLVEQSRPMFTDDSILVVLSAQPDTSIFRVVKGRMFSGCANSGELGNNCAADYNDFYEKLTKAEENSFMTTGSI